MRSKKMTIDELRSALAEAEKAEIIRIGTEMQRITGLTTWGDISSLIITNGNEISRLVADDNRRQSERKNQRKIKQNITRELNQSSTK